MKMAPLTATKRLRDHEIFMDINSGISKEDVCRKRHLSLTQLNRILRRIKEEAEEWYESLPRQAMIHIFHHSSNKVYEEICKLEQIRDKVKDDPKSKFDMTLKIIAAYIQYSKMVAEGPSLIRQKEVTEAAEKLFGSDKK